MKRFILLIFALGFIPILGSAQRPLIIDHSSHFEEPDIYFVDRQPLISALMILKASIWNAEISRDPNLAKNRFNGDYVWSKICDPETGEVYSAVEVAEVIKECGVLTRYSLPEFSNYTKQVKLSPKEEEEAFMFKTQAFFSLNIGEDNGSYQERLLLLRQLKDSLIRGKNFVISFPVYPDFWGRGRELYQYIDNEALYGAPETSYGVVMGYDDNIKTQKGYGAFLMRFNDASQPLVYYDYQWLLQYPGNFSCYFLQEKLKGWPKVALHMSISNSLDNLRENYGVYPFTDTLVSKSGTDSLYDYSNFFGDYRLYKSIAQVSEVDGKKLPQRKKRILLPINNGTGNYELTADLSSVASGDFQEIKVSVLDLAEGRYNYTIPGVKIGYLYDKPESAKVESAYVTILGTGEKIIGKVETLPDTVIYLEKFRSYIVDNFGEFSRPNFNVTNAIFTLRRKVITFSASDKIDNNPPVFSEYEERAITARLGQNEEFQFKAVDPDGDKVTYSLIGDGSSSFQINSQTGLVSFSPNSLGNHFATVLASDGNFTIMKDVQVLVIEANNRKPRFDNYYLYYEYQSLANVPRRLDFSIIDYDAGLDLPSYDLVEEPSSINSYYLDPYTGNFQFFGTAREDWYFFTVMAASQGDTLYHEFVIKVGFGDPIVDPVITTDEMSIDFKAYPNPVLNKLSLEVESDNFGDLEVAIFDMSGKLLNNFRKSCNIGPNHFYINTSEFKTGMYFFRVKMGEKSKTIKIVKE